MQRASTIFFVMLLGLAFVGPVDADPPVKFYLASQPEVPIPKLSLAELAKKFPAFKHRPFETAGFNAMVMPFHYQDKTTHHDGDAAEANALSFLISNDLDWSPACYCMRHAYFVFKKDPAITADLLAEYDPDRIQQLVKRWQATHAVGGTLIKNDGGYTGELEIYDAKGDSATTVSFDKPRSYFDLLGDMSTAAMKYFGPPANDALVKHLHLVRAKDPQSIILLGRAAFEGFRSDREMNLYDQVLEKDPGFADVRSYVAVQRTWMGTSVKEQNLQAALGLDSYLTSETMRTFWSPTCPKNFKAKVPQWNAEARLLWGPGSPKAFDNSLWDLPRGSVVPADAVTTAINAAAEYTNDYYSLAKIGRTACSSVWCGAPDQDLGASIFIAALQNRMMTGTGDKPEAASELGDAFRWMGHNELAVRVLQSPGLDDNSDAIFYLMITLEDIGRFTDELAVYDRLKETPAIKRDAMCAMHAGLAAALIGRVDLLEKVMDEKGDLIKRTGLYELLEAYRDVLHGKEMNSDQFAAASRKDRDWALQWFYDMLLAQLDLNHHTALFYDEVKGAAMNIPSMRPAWLLTVAYDQQKHRPELANLYRGLRWLYPDDPWVVSIVGRWTAEHPEEANAHPDGTAVNKALENYPAERWTSSGKQASDEQLKSFPKTCTPWDVAACIADVTDRHDYEHAKQLSLRYENFTAQLHNLPTGAWPNHLYYRVMECEAEGK